MRKLLLMGLSLALAACAELGMTPPNERIVEVASGREISRDELVQRLRANDYVLLGEQHDNPSHHQRRGQLLSSLGASLPVVAEHLTRGQTVQAVQSGGAALLPRLEAAGFSAQNWHWPLHEPLFAVAAAPEHLLVGGNISTELLRALARQGEAALPDDLKAVALAAPLNEAAREALDEDLIEGHCGMLPKERLPGMRWVQRARDAAMWLALQQVGQGHDKPAVLLAGNGHVRTDYGVAQLIAAQQPHTRFASVGFVETGAQREGLPYTYLWITAAPVREDPCAGMREMMEKASQAKGAGAAAAPSAPQ
jgi:uncharacterized iron-regulated protein